MKTVYELYEEKKMSAEEALNLIQSNDYIFSAQAAGEPQAILSHLQHLKETGVQNCILNTCLPLQNYEVFHDPEMKGILQHNGWFFNAALRKAHEEELVSAVPQSSTSILRKTMDRIKYENRRPLF